MKIIKDSGCKARWYVLGEGSEREMLEKKIAQLGLQKDFLLLGAVENPYPYYVQTDIYVHATGKEHCHSGGSDSWLSGYSIGL